MLEILFVCTGNTCRSPMAAALLNDKAQKRGLPIHASSAGLAAFTGDSASENAIKVMKEIGVDISSHRATRLSIYAIDSSDVVVCMSRSHKAALPDLKKIITFKNDVTDPYASDVDVYRNCRDELSHSIDELIETLSETVVLPMHGEDVKAVSEIEKECFSVPWSEKALLDELNNGTAHFFVAKQFNKAVGYIGMNMILDECYITNVAVSEKFRQNKIGSQLVEYAVTDAKNNGAAFISLEVRKSNHAAIALYEKYGFSVCGERKNFYDKPKEDGLIMTRFFDKEKSR